MISLADVLATTAAIVGDPLPDAGKGAEDSYNILPAILDQTTAPIRPDMVVHSADGVFAIRKGPWKWIEGVPVDEVAPGTRKAHADEYHPQLYNTHDDPGETKDLSATQPDLVKELRDLLNRYRNGGYSRELPPIVEKHLIGLDPLPPPPGRIVYNATLDQIPPQPWAILRGNWTAKEGAAWGAQKDGDAQGALLRAPLGVTDAVLQYEICFQGANRHSLRVESADRKHGFRIEVGRSYLAITKNPSQGEAADQVEPLARHPLALESGQWYPLRITFHGPEATAEIGGVTIKGSHPVIAEAKGAANFLVFGNTIGFRKVTLAEPSSR